MTKLLVNTYLTTKISYSNFVKNLCKDFDDISDLRVLESVGLDARIGVKFMLPGGPYSGPCLPRDNLSLKKFCLDNNIQNSFFPIHNIFRTSNLISDSIREYIERRII